MSVIVEEDNPKTRSADAGVRRAERFGRGRPKFVIDVVGAGWSRGVQAHLRWNVAPLIDAGGLPRTGAGRTGCQLPGPSVRAGDRLRRPAGVEQTLRDDRTFLL